jgi:hypothetical protein
MSITFSRSLRALGADRFRASLLGLLVVVILLAVWAAWFFLAEVGVYEISDSARLIDPDRASAEFPPSAAGRIRIGQTARLRLAAFPWAQYGTLSASVAAVSADVNEGEVRVALEIAPSSNSTIRLQPGMSASVEVEIERVSPAILALRAAGQLAAPAGGSSPTRQTEP